MYHVFHLGGRCENRQNHDLDEFTDNDFGTQLYPFSVDLALRSRPNLESITSASSVVAADVSAAALQMHFSLLRHNPHVARASVPWRVVNVLID